VPSIEQAYDWLIALSPIALYAAAFGLAFIENVFPPFPSDAFIAVCAFIAAPGESSLGLTYASVVAGNLLGAGAMYWVGRRYGAAGFDARLKRQDIERRERFQRMYDRYGSLALFLGRLVPGIRGLVPVAAGAIRINAGRAFLIVGAASVLWYGVLTTAAYRVGGRWDDYTEALAALSRWSLGVGVGIAAALVAAFLIWRVRSRARG